MALQESVTAGEKAFKEQTVHSPLLLRRESLETKSRNQLAKVSYRKIYARF